MSGRVPAIYFETEGDWPFEARYNVPPTASTPVVRADLDVELQLDGLRWQLVPKLGGTFKFASSH